MNGGDDFAWHVSPSTMSALNLHRVAPKRANLAPIFRFYSAPQCLLSLFMAALCNMLFIHHKGRRNTLTKEITDRVHTT